MSSVNDQLAMVPGRPLASSVGLWGSLEYTSIVFQPVQADTGKM